jgi:hypothetical protein
MRIRLPAGLLAVCSFLLAAQSSPRATSLPVQYSARLKISSPSDLDQRLQAPFAEGMAHPAGISNCTQLLTQRGRAAQTKVPEREFLAERSTMAECLILHELRIATAARSSYVDSLRWDEHALPLLPPQLAITISSEANHAAIEAAGRGRSWVDFDPSATASAQGPDKIIATGKGFSQQLILWGRGDFNGDGIEDLLVQSLDTLTEGTYRNIRLFVLTRRTPNGRLSVVSSLL